MKSYTDIEQSKKSAEILPIDSADMCYRIVAYNPNDTHEYQPYCFASTLEDDIPCWSLAALLNFLSANFYIEIKYLDTQWELDCRTQVTYARELVDACVELLYKLKERDLI